MLEMQERIIAEALRIIDEHHATPVRSIPWAVMSVIEEETDDITVGYGRDREMSEGRHGDETDWWDVFAPVEGIRFRVFYPRDEYKNHPPGIVHEAMAGIGATPVKVFTDDDLDSYDHYGRNSAHYLFPDSSPVVQVVARRSNQE